MTSAVRNAHSFAKYANEMGHPAPEITWAIRRLLIVLQDRSVSRTQHRS